MDKSKTIKNITYCIITLAIIMLLGNTNNNPTSFLVRLLPPIKTATSSFYYEGLIILIVLFILITELQRINEWKILESYWRRLACLVILLFFSSSFNEGLIKVYKSFQQGFDVIYLNREEMDLGLACERETTEDSTYEVYTGQGHITLKNCANKETQPFKIKIIVEDDMQPKLDKMINNAQEYILDPKEERRIELDFGEGLKEPSDSHSSLRSFRTRQFKIILYNDKEECVFEPAK